MAKTKEAYFEALAIDPLNPESWYKPLWVVYGHKAFPSIICCKLNQRDGEVHIWGYSVWKNQGGFRTLGTNVVTWMKQYELVKFFDKQELAIAYITQLVTPKEGIK